MEKDRSYQVNKTKEQSFPIFGDISLHTYTNTHTNLYIYIYTHSATYKCYVCVNVQVHICTNRCVYLKTHIHVCVYR